MNALLLAGLLTCGDLHAPEVERLDGKDAKITLELQSTSLDRVFDALGEQAGFRASFRGYTPIVGVTYRGVVLSQVLDELARDYALDIRSPAADRLDVRAPATVGVGGVTQPRGKDRKRPEALPGVSGKVVLNAVICEDGTVGAITPARATDEPRLLQAATEAVRQWTYEPAQKDGKPVAVSMTVTVEFLSD